MRQLIDNHFTALQSALKMRLSHHKQIKAAVFVGQNIHFLIIGQVFIGVPISYCLWYEFCFIQYQSKLKKSIPKTKIFHPIEIFFQTFYPMAIIFFTFHPIGIFFQTFYPMAIIFLLFILWQLFFQIFLSYSNYFFTFHPMADIFSFL